jgi:hypothetical protein
VLQSIAQERGTLQDSVLKEPQISWKYLFLVSYVCFEMPLLSKKIKKVNTQWENERDTKERKKENMYERGNTEIN